MNRVIREKRAYWIGGTVTAFVGVALVRLLVPQLDDFLGPLVLGAGYTLVVAGITILSCATRRKQSEAFVAVKIQAKDQDGLKHLRPPPEV